MQELKLKFDQRIISVVLPEMHCVIYFIIMNSKQSLTKQINYAHQSLKSIGYNRRGLKKEISKHINDCLSNPGFTFELEPQLVCIILKIDDGIDLSYFLSIAVHEICHAVYMHFRTLGLDINDDEHMALVQGNVFESFLRNFYDEV